MVEGVQEVGPELQPKSLSELKVLHQAEVEVGVTGVT
jgi:hypothetical protein